MKYLLAVLITLSITFTIAADFEWNTQGTMDYPAEIYGTSTNWGEYHITVVENDTGHDLTIVELGFSCSGPGPVDWLIWADVGGLNPPVGNPDSADYTGSFIPTDPNPNHTPTVYTDVDISGEGITIADGSFICFGYENPGSGGFSEYPGPNETWSWFNEAWDGDSQYLTTNCSQILANFDISSLTTTTFGWIKASFR